MSEQRYFSVAEANAALPEVRRLLRHVREAARRLDEIRTRLTTDGEVQRPAPDSRVDPDHLDAVGRFHQGVEQSSGLGIEIKDLGRGLVDFPSKVGEQEIRLCWLEGEDAVLYYHDLESGFSGRRLISELLEPPRSTDGSEEE